MKSLKLFSAALALALAFTGCQKAVFSGVDANAPAPKDVALDAESTTSSVLVVTWDGKESVNAGAASFSVQASLTAGTGDSYKADLTKTVPVDPKVDIYSAKFEGLVPGEYAIRVRANYPRSVYSTWEYIKSGTDTTYSKVTFAPPVIKDVVPSAKSISVVFEGKSEDVLKKYGITGMEVQYKEKSASDWTSFGKQSASSSVVLIDSGIKSKTTYVTRARYYSTKYSSDWAVSNEVTTLESKDLTIMTAEELIAAFNDGIDASMTITIGADLDFGGKSLPYKDVPCTIEGNNHVIKNLKNATPLFGEISSAVSNLVIDSSCEFTTGATTAAVFSTSATATAKITNITNKADLRVTISAAPEAAHVAAIIAKSAAPISGCVNEGDIMVEYTVDIASNHTLTFGGIAGHTDGPLTDCTNKGIITLNASDKIVGGALVGGVAGYANAPLANCINDGAVSAIAGSAWIGVSGDGYPPKYVNMTRVTLHVGGVVANTDLAGTVTDCKNTAPITYILEDMTRIANSIGTNRPQCGGVVGARAADVTNCENSGKIVCQCITPTRGVQPNTKNYVIIVSGVAGGDQGTTGAYSQSATSSNVKNCKNTGNIEVEFDNQNSYACAAGICGYPGVESNVSENHIIECTNYGNITVNGVGKMRIGGIAGGLGHITKCINYGTLTNNLTTTADDQMGGISGFHSQELDFSGNENYGDVIQTVAGLKSQVGGLIGSNGKVAATKAEGCKVKCNIVAETSNGATTVGLVLGSSPDATVTWGTADKPIEILNGTTITINGTKTVIDGSNYQNFLCGTTNSAKQTFNAVFK
ncbi:MAG: fibronectin type III domain-containing protein [Bacteroidaceae bacterium]|nr:fibronectin type III domain-containing protein [Bacteroidales bacterium]MCF0185486.1 fibronectin type III domain-containing protein [Bacteroidaceae bacterium]